MSVCEKCWSDAGGDMERYMEILKERHYYPCTPEQQAGTDKRHEHVWVEVGPPSAPYTVCDECGERKL